MLTHADVCSRMLTYAHVCSRMLTYADAAHAFLVPLFEYRADMLTDADVCIQLDVC
jgi:hypothetical protein